MKELNLTRSGPATTVSLVPPIPRHHAAPMKPRALGTIDGDTNGSQELYGCYVRYMRDLAATRNTEYRPRTFEDFSAWWCSLDTAARELFETKFRSGLAATLAESRLEIEQFFLKPA